MIAFISDLYEEYGILPFLLAGLVIFMIGFLIVVISLQGSDNCFHSFQFGDYCSYCGDALHEYCSNCGKVVDGASFCGSCGHALN